jgi:membrane-bound lytic murein transglycosylase D
MLGTGKMMGCDANSCVDERRDPIKSTEAATNYLKQLYDMYGDWQLALAAYNSGPGWVNKAIARAGTKNFWAIKYYLPSETRSYVPTYIAMVYAMKYATDYQLLSAEPKRELYAVDTVVVGGKVTLKHISNVLGISEAELQFINPSLKIGLVPLVKGGFPLNLPINYFVQFENKKEQILNDPTITSQEAIADGFANPEFIRVPKYVWYKVRRSDNLAGIAARYGVSASDIKQWNHLRSSSVQRGQNLKIMTYVQVPQYKKETQQPTLSGDSSSKSGDAEIGSTAELDTSENILYYIEKDASGNIIKRIMKPESQVIKPVTQSKPVPAKAAPVAPKSKVHLYKVQSGDTLSSIARRNGLTIAKLCSSNGLSTKSILHKGQVLKIVL